jgi:hypothetical protein
MHNSYEQVRRRPATNLLPHTHACPYPASSNLPRRPTCPTPAACRLRAQRGQRAALSQVGADLEVCKLSRPSRASRRRPARRCSPRGSLARAARRRFSGARRRFSGARRRCARTRRWRGWSRWSSARSTRCPRSAQTAAACALANFVELDTAAAREAAHSADLTAVSLDLVDNVNGIKDHVQSSQITTACSDLTRHQRCLVYPHHRGCGPPASGRHFWACVRLWLAEKVQLHVPRKQWVCLR